MATAKHRAVGHGETRSLWLVLVFGLHLQAMAELEEEETVAIEPEKEEEARGASRDKMREVEINRDK